VFVGGLPFASLDEATLRRDFGKGGAIERVTIPLNGAKKPKGIAFISYETQEGVDAALEFDGKIFGDRNLTVNLASQKPDKNTKTSSGVGTGRQQDQLFTAFVSGLPFSVSEEKLRGDFEEYGDIDRISFPLNDQGKPKGIAWIRFASEEAFEKALSMDDSDYHGRTIRVEAARPSEKQAKNAAPAPEEAASSVKQGKQGKQADKAEGRNAKKGKKDRPMPTHDHTAYIAGLPEGLNEAKLKKHFQECGEIEKFSLPMNEKGRSKGMAFIRYKTKEALEKALLFNKKEYKGCVLKVEVAGQLRKNKKKDAKDEDELRRKREAGRALPKGKGKGAMADKKGIQGKGEGAMADKKGIKKSKKAKKSFSKNKAASKEEKAARKSKEVAAEKKE